MPNTGRATIRRDASGPRRSARVGLLAALAVAGCNVEPIGPICTAIAVFGINLEVRGAGGAPAAQGAIGVAREGAFVDTLLVLDELRMAGAVERAGTYELEVSKPGHETWSATNVTVTEDECHVIPVQLDVNLIPTP